MEVKKPISALRGMFKPVLTNPDVTLVFEEPRRTLPLFTDDKKVSQILRNYIANALKFTQRGEVRVSATWIDGDGRPLEDANEGDGNANAVPGDAAVRFAVADTGIGIAPEFHGVIFQDFSQVDSPLQKRLRGTGLGLSLSKLLAELLGGSVAFQSQVGRGSTFMLTVPQRLRLPTSRT